MTRKNFETTIYCDGFGCDESHPVSHEYEGEFGFKGGRWLGWVYLDLNRVDLVDRPLRFCDLKCLRHWFATNARYGGLPRIDPDDPSVRLNVASIKRAASRSPSEERAL